MSMFYRIIAILVGLSFSLTMHGQRYALMVDNPQDIYKKERFGPNRAWHSFAMIDIYGAGIPIGQGLSNYSDMLGISWQIKQKLSRYFDHGIGMGLIYQGRRFDAETAQILYTQYAPHDPSIPIPDWDRMKHNQMGLEALYFFRFQLQPFRGNVIGSCIDLGVRVGFIPTEHSQFKLHAQTRTVEDKQHQLAFVERTYVDVELRFNYRFISLFSRHRVWAKTVDRSLPERVFRPSLYLGLGIKL